MSPPYYNLADVLVLVAADAWEPGTQKCRDDILSLGMTRGDVAKVLLGITSADFRKAFGTCTTFFGDLDGDDYVVWVDDVTFDRCAPNGGLKLYVKFGVDVDVNGEACVLVSFHESLR